MKSIEEIKYKIWEIQSEIMDLTRLQSAIEHAIENGKCSPDEAWGNLEYIQELEERISLLQWVLEGEVAS